MYVCLIIKLKFGEAYVQLWTFFDYDDDDKINIKNTLYSVVYATCDRDVVGILLNKAGSIDFVSMLYRIRTKCYIFHEYL